MILSNNITYDLAANSIIIDTRGISLFTKNEAANIESTDNLYECKIIGKSFKERAYEFKIQVNSQTLISSFQPNYWGETPALDIGQKAYAKINSEFIYGF